MIDKTKIERESPEEVYHIEPYQLSKPNRVRIEEEGRKYFSNKNKEKLEDKTIDYQNH